MSPRRPRVITVCRYHPGERNEYQTATGAVVKITAGAYLLLIDRTEVIFGRPTWFEVTL